MTNNAIEKLLKDRYYLPNEDSWEKLANRVGDIYPPIKAMIAHKTFIPSSPTLMNYNVGEGRSGTLSSCFTMDIEDSVSGIFDSLKECALVTKAGGGCGLVMSKLRSSSENVASFGSNSSGPIPFMKMFDSMFGGMLQSGKRRGACMCQFDITHPDIIDVIKIKAQKGLENMNISIRIPDDFYNQLDIDPTIPHVVQNMNGEWSKLEYEGKIWSVKDVWDLITYHATYNAEPGIFHSDIATRQCTTSNISSYVLSNPCFTGDTLIAVADGRKYVPIKQLAESGNDVNIYSYNREGNLVIAKFMNPRLTRKNADVYKVTFDSGLTVKVTEDHNFMTTDGQLIKLKDLSIGASIKSAKMEYQSFDKIYGGTASKNKAKYIFWKSNGKYISDHRLICENKIGRKLYKNEIVHHKNFISTDNSPDNLIAMDRKEHIQFHSSNQMGDKNPVHRIYNRDLWRKRIAEKSKGLSNGHSYPITNEEIIEKIKQYVETTFDNYFTTEMWINDLKLPLLNCDDGTYRYNSVVEYCSLADVAFLRSDMYNNLVFKYNHLKENNYIFDHEKGSLDFNIYKKCEYCGNEFITKYENRHITFCSKKCIGQHLSKPFIFTLNGDNFEFSEKYLKHPNVQNRIDTVYNLVCELQELKRKNITYVNLLKEHPGARTIVRPNNIFAISLKYILSILDKVTSRDDIIHLSKQNISQFIDKNDLSEKIGSSFNHKIVSIEYYGCEDVYDGTVEEFHNLLVGAHEIIDENNEKSYDFVCLGQCAEFIGNPYSSCNLGSIDISKCLIKPNIENNYTAFFNWKEFEKIIRLATRYLNNVIDVNSYPLEKIKDVTLNVRPIGIGIMGLAHALFKLHIPFNSEEAYIFKNKMSYFLTMISMDESNIIAIEEGKSYPAFDFELFKNANRRLFEKDIAIKEIFDEQGFVDRLLAKIERYGIANSCFTSIAPTGSISFIANTSSGLEPVFALVFTRDIQGKDGKEIAYITDPVFKQYLDNNFTAKEVDNILNDVANNNGSCQKNKLIPDKYKKIFVTATDISPMDHLNSLANIAPNISTACAKTVNLPSTATQKEVSDIYRKAHKLGIIGLTVYKDGCRDGVLKTTSAAKIETTPTVTITKDISPAIKRPRVLDGKIYQIPEGNNRHIYCTISHIDNDKEKKPWEMFIDSSGDRSEEFAAIGRLASRLMRKTGDVKGVIEELREVTGTSGYFTKEYGYVNSKIHHFSHILEEYNNSLNPETNKEIKSEQCPECKQFTLRREGGCSVCTCGYSKC